MTPQQEIQEAFEKMRCAECRRPRAAHDDVTNAHNFVDFRLHEVLLVREDGSRVHTVIRPGEKK